MVIQYSTHISGTKDLVITHVLFLVNCMHIIRRYTYVISLCDFLKFDFAFAAKTNKRTPLLMVTISCHSNSKMSSVSLLVVTEDGLLTSQYSSKSV